MRVLQLSINHQHRKTTLTSHLNSHHNRQHGPKTTDPSRCADNNIHAREARLEASLQVPEQCAGHIARRVGEVRQEHAAAREAAGHIHGVPGRGRRAAIRVLRLGWKLRTSPLLSSICPLLRTLLPHQ